MKALAALVATILIGIASTCFAAENGKQGKESALTSYQLGDYSLGLDTDDPNKPASSEPPGLVTLRQETIRPFVGFRLSGPLPDSFFGLGQVSEDERTPKKAKASKRRPNSHKHPINLER